MKSILKYLTELTKFDPVKHKDGAYSKSGIWNDIKWINGKAFKERAEVLIFNDKGEVFLEKRSNKYRIPGGAIERRLGHDGTKTVFKESQEEARITIKNIKDTGVTYIDQFGPAKWELEEHIPFDGKIVYVFIAEYDKKYRGQINEKDQDLNMVKNGRFYPIKDVTNPNHIKALKKVRII